MGITRRDLLVAFAAAGSCASAMLLAAPLRPVLGPAVFAWPSLSAKETDVGEVRAVVRAPTATLDELEMHVTTLNPGAASHPPHRAGATKPLLPVKNAIGGEIHTGMMLRIEVIMGFRAPCPPPPGAIRQHACRGLEDIAAEPFHVADAASAGQAEEHFLDEILRLRSIADPATEETVQRGPE